MLPTPRRARSSTPALALSILAASGIAACSGSDVTDDAGLADAGSPDSGAALDAATPDAAPIDAGPPFECEDTTRLDAVLDDTVTLMFDTSMTETRPRDLGPSCGNTGAELRWAPQEVIELHVPGAGQMVVSFDTAFEETDMDFNTVVQVRRACEQVPAGTFPPTCFDDIGPMEYRTQGAFSAMGGDVVYVVVTGYSRPPANQGTRDSGRVRIDFTTRSNAAPTLESGSLVLAVDDTFVEVSGGDPDQDAQGVAMTFWANGEQLDIYGDGVADENDVYAVAFTNPPTQATFMNAGFVVLGAEVNLAGYLRSANATHARLRIYDSGWALSDALEVPVQEAQIAGLGDPCGPTTICAAPLECGAGGTCEAPPAVTAACTAATAITLPAISTTAMSVDQVGVTGAGAGLFAPNEGCVQQNGASGAETIYAVEVPTGAVYDLLVTTERPGTMDTDTIVYLRAECVDGSTELACNDDRAQGDLQSDAEALGVTEGTYFVFVERYGGASTGTFPHELRVTARPVLDTGANCDDAGVLNRCAGAPCSSGTCP